MASHGGALTHFAIANLTIPPATNRPLLGLLAVYIDGRLAAYAPHRATEMYRCDAVGIDLLPAVDVIEQLGRSTLRPQQGRLDIVRVEQTEQVFGSSIPDALFVIDEEGLAEQFGCGRR